MVKKCLYWCYRRTTDLQLSSLFHVPTYHFNGTKRDALTMTRIDRLSNEQDYTFKHDTNFKMSYSHV